MPYIKKPRWTMVGHLRGHFKKKLLVSLVMVFAYLWLRDFFKIVLAVDQPLISVRLASSMEICSRRVVSRSSHLACIQRCNFFSEKKEDSKSYRYRDVTLFYPIHWGKIVLGLIFCHFLLWFFRLGFFTGVFGVENIFDDRQLAREIFWKISTEE